MKLKAAISSRAPNAVFAVFESEWFAEGFLDRVVTGCFGAENPVDRPAEYYVQLPDRTVQLADIIGVELRLTGVSRGTRPPKLFHEALRQLEQITLQAVEEAILGTDTRVHVFVVIMLDKDVPALPNSTAEVPEYSSVFESAAKWVTCNGIEDLDGS